MVLRNPYEKTREHKLLICIATLFVVTLILIVLFLSYYLVFTYPINQISQYGLTNTTEKASLINQYRITSIQLFATIVQTLGGIAVGMGIYFAWRNIKIAQEGQVTERFSRAIDQLGTNDQLGNPAIEIRIGGIYALGRILDVSYKDYWAIMETLTAYVRNNSSVESKSIKGTERQDELSNDIKAILDVLRRRKCSIIENKPNKLTQARFYLWKYMLFYKSLKVAHKGGNTTGVILSEFNRTQSKFKDREPGSLNLEKSYLRKANLLGGYFKQADFNNTYLCEATLASADFTDANFSEANLKDAFLLFTDFTKANLDEADLTGAKFVIAKLIGTTLKGADLREADLTGADLRDADLEDADLGDAYFLGADLRGAKNLTIDQLSQVKTLYNAKLDEKFLIPLKKSYPTLFDKLEDES